MNAIALEGGFKQPAFDSAFAFRAMMEAMARPGEIKSVLGARPPAPLSVAAGVAILTLCDPDTPVYLGGSLDTQTVRYWISFHTGAPLSGPAMCSFAVGTWEDLTPLSQFPIGTPEYPDRSATLIIERKSLKQTGATLQGPGIRDKTRFELPDTNALSKNAALFPLGLDFYFTAGDRIAGLPRSTRID
ncbi:MAG: phosphonate C-P lyase system protein PhnH [Pseudomonadota bacterium]